MQCYTDVENVFIGVPLSSKYIQVRLIGTIVFKTLSYISFDMHLLVCVCCHNSLFL